MEAGWRLLVLGVAALRVCHGQPGIITTIAGSTSGKFGFAGDGGPATSALLDPAGIAIDGPGNIYVAEPANHRIRKVDTAGIITTLAGNGVGGFSGDGGPATAAMISGPERVAVDGAGNVYFMVLGGRIRKVNKAGIISTAAGNGSTYNLNDGGQATSAGIAQHPGGVAVDGAGNFYFADLAYYRIRKVNTAGIITTVAGNGTAGFAGDGGPATSAQIRDGVALTSDTAGNLYFVDQANRRIRKVSTAGVITTVAGTGIAGYSGDGGLAIRATISDTADGLAVDGAGNLFISDHGNWAVRRIDAAGIIATVAGTGKSGFSGDGGAATASTLASANDVAADATGNLYIADSSRVRKVNPGSAAIGGASTGPVPTITAVVDAAAYTANIAQGSVFVVKGKNLCGTGTVFGSVPYSTVPLNGASITFTPVGGGAGTDAYMVYTYSAGAINQLAAILPSNVATGDYNVTVTNSGSFGAGFRVTVVAHKFGIITVNGSGAGRSVVQNYISASQYDLGRYTTGTIGGYTYSPAHPGQIIVIWGTGMGAITSPDNSLPGAIDLRGALNIQVMIDGTAFSPDLYAGRAPTLPGADEIVMTLPPNVSTGCLLSLQISVNGQLSNATTVSIASGTDNACTAPGITAAQLAKLDQGGNFTVGTMTLSGGVDTRTSAQGVTSTIRVDEASAIFVSLNADQLNAGVPGAVTTVANGTCVVTRQIVTVPTSGSASFAFSFLDAGKLVLNGPDVTNVNVSLLTLLTANVAGVSAVQGAVLAAGTYTITGPGGKDVGPFQASLQMAQPLVVSGGVASTIQRSQDLTLKWTGGGTASVTITGSSGVAAAGSTPANPIVDSGIFKCVTTADKGGFTVPTSVLQQIPAANGNLNVSSNNVMSTFTAPLVAGGNLDYGYFSAGFANQYSVAYK